MALSLSAFYGTMNLITITTIWLKFVDLISNATDIAQMNPQHTKSAHTIFNGWIYFQTWQLLFLREIAMILRNAFCRNGSLSLSFRLILWFFWRWNWNVLLRTIPTTRDFYSQEFSVAKKREIEIHGKGKEAIRLLFNKCMATCRI